MALHALIQGIVKEIPDLLREVKRSLRTHGIRPSKRLGQNFLVNSDVFLDMISHASVGKDDTVLEIGTGLGFLTDLLADRAGYVVSVETDTRLFRIAKKRLRTKRNVKILRGDVLKTAIPPFTKVVSTPPYSISSPLLFWLLDREFQCGVLTFQREFAERLSASPGTKDYGRLTVTTYYRAEVELLDPVPKEMFWPPPEVDSRIVRLRPRKPPFMVEDEEIFLQTVRVIFTRRNKKLRNAIRPLLNRFKFPKRETVAIADLLPFHKRRPRELAPEEIGLLANEIVKHLRERRIH